jgi:hypothetical protein
MKESLESLISAPLYHTWFLCQNQVLIVYMTQDQLFHTYDQKQSLMRFFTSLVDQYIIDEHHDKLVQILHEDLVHHVHKVGRCISQSK